ncbi:MAG: GspMb/PilO family protein [Acidobacteriota bacterium]
MTETRGVMMRRIMREHRAWIWPLAVLVAANVVALTAGVLPMSRSVRSAEVRAKAAAADAAEAVKELAAATTARDGRDTATRELSQFYREVLPADVAGARRLLQLRVGQLARAHDVTFTRSVVTPEHLKGSDLDRLQARVELVGRYRDVRGFLYELETADDFVVVDSIVLAEGEDATAPLDLTLVISTYYKASADVP